ncbi:MAG: DoxX family protein [Bacteroidota bacterium]
MNKTTVIVLWVCRIVAAVIMSQSLFFKFSAAPESVYIFSTLGLEPVGRIGSGVGELIASILLLIPATSWLGALMGLGVISGAIFFHLTKLGIEIQGDGGQLFIYAVLVFISCAIVAWISRHQIPVIKTLFSAK